MIVRGSLPRGLGKLWVLHVGTFAGEVKKGRFLPRHIACFLPPTAAHIGKSWSFHSKMRALSRFLAGEAVACPEDWSGFVPVCAERFPIGFGKAVDGMMKNHLAKGPARRLKWGIAKRRKGMELFQAGKKDLEDIVALAHALFEGNEMEALRAEMEALLHDADAAIFLCRLEGMARGLCAMPAAAGLCGRSKKQSRRVS